MEAWQFPWDTPPAPVAVPENPASAQAKRKPRGRRPAAVTGATERAKQGIGPGRTTEPGWLYHHLTISGPADIVGNFAAAARGSGVTLWQLDFAAIEEDVFVRAVSQPAGRRSLTVEGCRTLARQFRERVEARQARATEHAREGVARVGQSLCCPFDLHVLLPVPGSILLLGPAHPTALAWLAAHWGVTDRLRQVAIRKRPATGRRLPAGHAVIGYGFFTFGETPRAAIAEIAARWPALRFRLVPRPAD
jgi:hypothetical protein